MSKDIPTLGKIWLCIMLVLGAIGVISNLLSVGNGIIYLISALACIAEVYGLVFLLKGKGTKFYLIYSAGYLVNVILVLMQNIQANNVSTSYIVGFILGIAINLGLTYLSAKKTINLKKLG